MISRALDGRNLRQGRVSGRKLPHGAGLGTLVENIGIRLAHILVCLKPGKLQGPALDLGFHVSKCLHSVLKRIGLAVSCFGSNQAR